MQSFRATKKKQLWMRRVFIGKFRLLTKKNFEKIDSFRFGGKKSICVGVLFFLLSQFFAPEITDFSQRIFDPRVEKIASAASTSPRLNNGKFGTLERIT